MKLGPLEVISRTWDDALRDAEGDPGNPCHIVEAIRNAEYERASQLANDYLSTGASEVRTIVAKLKEGAEALAHLTRWRAELAQMEDGPGGEKEKISRTLKKLEEDLRKALV